MNKTRKTRKILKGVVIILVLILLAAAGYINSVMPIITGYAAKNLCSDVFVSGRDAKNVESVDLAFSFIRFTRNSVDYENKSVTSSFLWGRSKAVYRYGFGSTLLRGVTENELRRNKYPLITGPGFLPDTVMWPIGNIIPDKDSTGIDRAKIEEIARQLVIKDTYHGNIFAFMVLHKGIPVVESYKTGFDVNTRFLSWSMAKSFINAVTGLLVRDGILNISKPTGIDEWQDDDRKNITLNDLLQMQSGLKWNEDYGSRSDVNLMLFNEEDMARYAIEQPLSDQPGTNWFYSSGTVNIISSIIRNQFINDSSYYTYVQKELFQRIGIMDAEFEVDPTGMYVGSSYLYATARDYARFGLLYLNDGVVGGERILPEGWVSYTTTPGSSSKGNYGALFWLNKGGEYPSAPRDLYSCEGHDDQMIFILPSKKLVVVILGFSHRPENGIDLDRLLKDIMGTL